jgi:hypothetical protein
MNAICIAVKTAYKTRIEDMCKNMQQQVLIKSTGTVLGHQEQLAVLTVTSK